MPVATPPPLRAVPARSALHTGQLLGHLKNVQIAYLRFAKLLARVRDEKIYEVLNHEDVISYAVEHLELRNGCMSLNAEP